LQEILMSLNASHSDLLDTKYFADKGRDCPLEEKRILNHTPSQGCKSWGNQGHRADNPPYSLMVISNW
jgi:hypothetical protein